MTMTIKVVMAPIPRLFNSLRFYASRVLEKSSGVLTLCALRLSDSETRPELRSCQTQTGLQSKQTCNFQIYPSGKDDCPPQSSSRRNSLLKCAEPEECNPPRLSLGVQVNQYVPTRFTS
jgi:hypothetical protein